MLITPKKGNEEKNAVKKTLGDEINTKNLKEQGKKKRRNEESDPIPPQSPRPKTRLAPYESCNPERNRR